MKLQLKVKQGECAGGVCPMPLNFLAGAKKGITSVDYDEGSGMAVIDFDEKLISQEEVMEAIKKMKYEILEATNG